MPTVYLDNTSKGEVIKVNNLSIGLPKKPNKSAILFSNLTKKNQFWKRDKTDWEFLSNKQKEKFIIQEFERRLNGVWFMNNGEPTYITGNHYYYLQWCKIDIGYPDYRDRDRRFFMFWDACKKDPKSYGMVMVKHRREGASWKAACLSLYEITSKYNAHGGLLSKTGQDAKDLFEKVVYMFRGLPDFFQPIIDGSDNPKSKLSFSAPGQKISKNYQKVVKSEALNSKIDWRNTKENSYDSAKLNLFVSDEAGKWMEASIQKNWQVVKPCLTQGRKVIGKCFMPSTVNELTKGGGENFKKIFYDSFVEDRDGNGETVSGLYAYFTPAYDGYEGFIDKYGNSEIEKAKKYLDNRRQALKKDTIKLSEEKRQRPYTVDEAFRSDVNKSIFDVEKIYQQLEYNSTIDNLTTKGNFIWSGGNKDGEVKWIPDNNGKWEISWLPPKQYQNKVILKSGRKYPGNETLLVSGCDPYDHDTTTDGRRSDAACHTYLKFNMAFDFSEVFVCEYINRPPKAEIFYEDMIKQCVFYGCPILVENNKIGIIKYFERRGYYDYLMDRPESTHTSNSKAQKTKGIPGSGEAVINAQAEITQAYIYDHVGYNEETGDVGMCYFNKLLKDWSEFDITNRTKFDASISSSLALLGSQKIVKKKQKIKFTPFVKSFNNTGIISRKSRNVR